VLRVPPLRERTEDIPLLAAHFIRRRRQQQGLPPLTLSAQAREVLQAYAWPGNVRELRNVIERALITASQAEQIEVRHLGALAPGGAAPAAAPPATPTAWMPTGEPTLESIEREYLATLLKKYGGNRRKVAEVMGVSERTAYRMMDRHGYK